MRSGIGNSSSDPLFVSQTGAGPSTSATSTSVTPASDATSNPFPVIGNAAAGAVDAGNPVKVAGTDGTNVRTLRTDTTGNTVVVGNVANNVGDSGNPIKIGGYASSSIPTTVSSTARVNAWFSLNGALNTIRRGLDNFATAQVTVATTATVIAASRVGRDAVTITNLGTTDVFVGLAGVTIATGTLLVGTKGATVTIPANGAVYGIVGTGTQAVSVLETY